VNREGVGGGGGGAGCVVIYKTERWNGPLSPLSTPVQCGRVFQVREIFKLTMISDRVCLQYTDEDVKLNIKLHWVTGTVDDGRLNIMRG
jgi:hypothetical protein